MIKIKEKIKEIKNIEDVKEVLLQLNEKIDIKLGKEETPLLSQLEIQRIKEHIEKDYPI